MTKDIYTLQKISNLKWFFEFSIYQEKKSWEIITVLTYLAAHW